MIVARNSQQGFRECRPRAATGTPQGRAITATGAAVRLLRARWLVRAPIRCHQARLGFVLGARFLMLEHAGRTSGLKRYVVLEVVDHPSPDRYVVASGFGTRAQWFRNLQANPAVRVYLRSKKPVSATARLLPPEETSAVLAHYETRDLGQRSSQSSRAPSAPRSTRCRSSPSTYIPRCHSPGPDEFDPVMYSQLVELRGAKPGVQAEGFPSHPGPTDGPPWIAGRVWICVLA